MPGPAKWGWNISNGDASAAATAAAYTALTTGGRTAAFTAPVWNDILAKISAQRVFWTDTTWDTKTPSLVDTRMASGDIMTAQRFNAAVKNMPPIKSWPWQSTLRRTNIKSGDRCYGAYFIYLTDSINHWIDLIPVPVEMLNALTSSMIVDSHVLPSIPIKVQKPLKIVWQPEIVTQLNLSESIKQQLEFCHDGLLDVQVFVVNHVIIVNFSHVITRNHVTVHPTAHAITDINILLQDQYGVSLGDCELIKVDLPFTDTATGTISSGALLSIITDIVAGTFDLSATVHAARYDHIAFNLIARLLAETYAREQYSLPLCASFSIIESTNFAFCCQRVNTTVADLVLFSSVNATLSTKILTNFASNSQYTTNFSAHISTLIRHLQFYKADLNDTFSFGVGACIAERIATGANLDDLIAIFANACCSEMLHSGADLLSALSLSAGLDTKAMQVISAMLSSELNLTATGGTLRPDSISASLSTASSLSAAVFTWLPTLGFSFSLSGKSALTTSMVKIACLAFCMTATLQHTGSSDVTLSTAHTAFANVTGLHSGSATISYVTMQPVKSDLHTVHTVTSSVSFLAPTLVSEIENDFVSDLDDVLVTDVEFSIH